MKKILGFVFAVSAAVPTSAKDMNIDSLKAALANPKNGIKDLDSFMRYLSKNGYEEYLYKQAPEWDSISLQESSKQNPRMMMFGNTPGFIMSYNGNARHKGFGDIEVAAFDPIKKRTVLYSVRLKTGTVVQEPPECMTCHGNGLSIPIGTFGTDREATDKLTKYFFEEKCRKQVDADGKPISGLDANGEPIRRLNRDGEPIVSPYDWIDCAKLKATFGDLIGAQRAANKGLGALDAERVANIIYRTPDYERYRYTILGALGGCGSPEMDNGPTPGFLAFLPKGEAAFAKADFAAERAEWINKDFKRARKGAEFEAFDKAQLAAFVSLTHVMENRGVDLVKGDAKVTAFGSTMDPYYSVTSLIPALVAMDPVLRAMNKAGKIPIKDLEKFGRVTFDGAPDASTVKRVRDFCTALSQMCQQSFASRPASDDDGPH